MILFFEVIESVVVFHSSDSDCIQFDTSYRIHRIGDPEYLEFVEQFHSRRLARIVSTQFQQHVGLVFELCRISGILSKLNLFPHFGNSPFAPNYHLEDIPKHSLPMDCFEPLHQEPPNTYDSLRSPQLLFALRVPHWPAV